MNTNTELQHWGVMGMHWGVRKPEGLPGVSNKTYKEAKKDAEEHTRAKLFYGEGAGTRRKLSKATVETKAKRDPTYKKAFDHHVANTDFATRASQARGERKRKDVVSGTAKTARGVKNLVLKTGANATLLATVIYGGYAAWKNPAVNAVVKRISTTGMDNVRRLYGAAKLKGMGF